MHKLWQWFRDKKSNTVRKWRSSVFFGSSRRVDSEFDPFAENGLFRQSESQLGVQRQVIGGSDSRLTQPPSKSRRTLQTLQRKLTPNKRHRASQHKLSVSQQDVGYANSTNEMRQLLLDEEDIYHSQNSVNLSPEPSPSASHHSSQSYDDTIGAELPPIQRRHRGFSYSTMKSPNSPDLNSPTSPKTRRKLRFVIPQVSLSTVDNPNAETTLLVGSTSQDSLEDEELRESLDNFAEDLYPSHKSFYSPGSARRSLPDNEKRRYSSMVPRRQSTFPYKSENNISVNELVQSVSGRRTSTTLIPLTVAQIHLVRSLWKQVFISKGPTVIGETFVHRLFFKCPKMKDQFRRCPLPDNYANHDSFAKFHYKAVVESLDNLELVGEELERIGRIHATALNGQLSSKIWNSVAETFIDCTLEWGDRRCRSETVRKAWALIIAYLTEKLKHGHLEQRKQMLTMKSTIASLERIALAHTSRS